MAGNPGSGLDELAVDDDEDVEMNVAAAGKIAFLAAPEIFGWNSVVLHGSPPALKGAGQKVVGLKCES